MTRARPIANLANRQGASADFWVDGDDWFPGHVWSGAGLDLSYGALGLVRLRVRADRVALLWNSESADPVGLGSALAFLECLGPERRCDLRYVQGAWIDESYPSHLTAIQRVREIQGSLGSVTFLPGVAVNRRPLDQIEDAHPDLQATLQILNTTGVMDWSATPCGRSGIVFERSDNGLIYRHVGDRAQIRRCLGDLWWRSAIGRPVDNAFSDNRFNQSANRSYALAQEEQHPLFETVLANVKVGARRMILPFERLTVPLGEHLAVMVKFRNGPILAGAGERNRPAYLEVA